MGTLVNMDEFSGRNCFWFLNRWLCWKKYVFVLMIYPLMLGMSKCLSLTVFNRNLNHEFAFSMPACRSMRLTNSEFLECPQLVNGSLHKLNFWYNNTATGFWTFWLANYSRLGLVITFSPPDPQYWCPSRLCALSFALLVVYPWLCGRVNQQLDLYVHRRYHCCWPGQQQRWETVQIKGWENGGIYSQDNYLP